VESPLDEVTGSSVEETAWPRVPVTNQLVTWQSKTGDCLSRGVGIYFFKGLRLVVLDWRNDRKGTRHGRKKHTKVVKLGGF